MQKSKNILIIIAISFAIIISVLVFSLSEKEKNSLELGVCKAEPYCFSAKVTEVIDGDTIYVKHLTTNEPIRIRLSLVDTQEKGEPMYLAGKDFTSTLCPVGSIVIIDQDDIQKNDSYGRMLGIVYCNGILLNEELLKEELAEIIFEFCTESEFGKDEWAIRYGC